MDGMDNLNYATLFMKRSTTATNKPCKIGTLHLHLKNRRNCGLLVTSFTKVVKVYN